MNWRAYWARMSEREHRLIVVAGVVLVLLLIRSLVITPFLGYRENLQEEIAADREEFDNAQRYLARAGDIQRQRDLLQARLQQVRAQLVPGDTPTLAAANLQNTLHSLAAEKSVEIQSTQVMRDDTVGDLKRVAVRITVTGELKGLADFLAGVEYGPLRMSISFLEISRRGAVLRGKGARALSATIEVNAFARGVETEIPKANAAADGTATAPASSPAAGPPPVAAPPAMPAPGGARPGGRPHAAPPPAAPLPAAPPSPPPPPARNPAEGAV